MAKVKLGYLLDNLPDEALFALSEEVYTALDDNCNANFIPDDWKYDARTWVTKWNSIRPIYAPNEDVLMGYFTSDIYEVEAHDDECRGGVAMALYAAFRCGDFNLSHKAFSINTLDEVEFQSFPTFKDLLKYKFFPLKTTMWEVMVNFLNGDTHPFETIEDFNKWLKTIVYHEGYNRKEKAERTKMGWYGFYDYYPRHYWLRWEIMLDKKEA